MDILKKLFSYGGRMQRMAFWLFCVLPVGVLSAGIYLLPDYVSIPVQYNGMVTVGSYAVIAWIATAGLTKRLHDRNRSGGYHFIFFAPAVALYALYLIYYPHPGVIALAIATGFCGLWLVIETGFAPGTIGQNNYGEDPALFEKSTGKWTPLKNTPAISDPKLDARAIKLTEKPAETEVINSWLGRELNERSGEPEILATTASTFEAETQQNTETIVKPTDEPSVSPSLPLAAATLEENTELKQDKANAEKSLIETDRFLGILKERATTNPAHAIYLQRGAMTGNSWAKLEIAATWLSDPEVTHHNSKVAMQYLRELADAERSYLGAEKEAAYFLGEIYRIGMRFTLPNKDLSFKYYIQAASLGQEAAQRSLAAQIARALQQGLDNSPIEPLMDAALIEADSATTLLQLIEFDWSITYAESLPLILRTLVDQGNGQAARYLGRMSLENNDLETAIKILNQAEQLDHITIDKMMEVIRAGIAKDEEINALIDLLRKHAELDEPYAHQQVSIAYREGLGLPEDQLLAYVHICLAAARIHGRDRDTLTSMRDEIKKSLTDEEISTAQTLIRNRFEQ